MPMQVIKDFVESEKGKKKGKTELRLQGLTGHEAAEKVRLSMPPSLNTVQRACFPLAWLATFLRPAGLLQQLPLVSHAGSLAWT